jgi:diacylglycerol kinase family enzyme
MLRRDYREDPRMLFLRARAVRIEAPAGTPAQFDGEALPGPVLEARVVPGGVRFLLPGR